MTPDRPARAGSTPARVGWLIFPAVAGGLVHVVVLKTNALRGLAIPIDDGAMWRDRPVFGANKTWRGVAVMTGSTMLMAEVEARLVTRRRWTVALAVVEDMRLRPWLAGAVTGFSYCVAELPNSFVKRRLGIGPGERTSPVQYLVDQIDSVIGCLVGLRLVYRPTRGEVVWIFLLGTGIHITIDGVLHLIGVKPRTG